ncbi:MAG: type II toxin-antitoxin system Phd/YefM family antitoxin [Blastocatellia bacterium]|nr:type II toxin-antitoxin system Phd/YefM family antitoxin [Blastocatellia bacterium]
MVNVNIHEAKTQLSRLLLRVAAGEMVIISRSGKPIARIVPFTAPERPRPLGMDRGLFEVPEDFDAPLPENLLAAFEGRS